ncbi:MAG TPA: glycosyltransferase, partial [Nitrososphaeraceae archaeon]|nr:glycosyltransferase [Nitrososphaeraceae archaeon]
DILHYKRFVNDAINGILAQSYNNLELIIVVDNKHEPTINYMKKFIKTANDSRIKLFSAPSRLGPGRISNAAIKYTSGDFLVFHDQDDLSYQNRFQKLIENININGIVASYIHITSNNKIREKIYSGYCLDRLLTMSKVRTPVHFPSVMITKDLFTLMGGFENYFAGIDAIFIAKLGFLREILGLGPIPIVEEFLFAWNRHSHQITSWHPMSIKLRQCEKKQRRPLVKIFRKKLIDNEIDTNNIHEIMECLNITNNLQSTVQLKQIC